jgi:hypothetical protein
MKRSLSVSASAGVTLAPDDFRKSCLSPFDGRRSYSLPDRSRSDWTHSIRSLMLFS